VTAACVYLIAMLTFCFQLSFCLELLSATQKRPSVNINYWIAIVTFCCELSFGPTVRTTGCCPEPVSEGTTALI
jgi:hypothetical protein